MNAVPVVRQTTAISRKPQPGSVTTRTPAFETIPSKAKAIARPWIAERTMVP